MSHSWAELLKRVVGTDREVVLFGGGTIAGRILNEALDVQDSNFLRIRYIIDNDAARAVCSSSFTLPICSISLLLRRFAMIR